MTTCRLILTLILVFGLYMASTIDSKAGMVACCINYPSGECTIVSSNEVCANEEDGVPPGGGSCSPNNPCDEPPKSIGDCCSEHESTGCNISECEDTVCAEDPFCCIVEWDDICVDEAKELCGDTCGVSGPVVIVPTMTQWGIIFASIILGAIGIVAIFKKEEYE